MALVLSLFCYATVFFKQRLDVWRQFYVIHGMCTLSLYSSTCDCVLAKVTHKTTNLFLQSKGLSSFNSSGFTDVTLAAISSTSPEVVTAWAKGFKILTCMVVSPAAFMTVWPVWHSSYPVHYFLASVMWIGFFGSPTVWRRISISPNKITFWLFKISIRPS